MARKLMDMFVNFYHFIIQWNKRPKRLYQRSSSVFWTVNIWWVSTWYSSDSSSGWYWAEICFWLSQPKSCHKVTPSNQFTPGRCIFETMSKVCKVLFQMSKVCIVLFASSRPISVYNRPIFRQADRIYAMFWRIMLHYVARSQNIDEEKTRNALSLDRARERKSCTSSSVSICMKFTSMHVFTVDL